MNKLNDSALNLHQKSIIVDMLNPSKITRDYLLSMKKSGITASNITLAGAKHGDVAHIRNTPSDVIDDLTRFNKFINDNNDIAIPIRCSADIEKAKSEGKVGIINGFQNSLPIREDLSLVKIYYNLGVRIIQLTYNEKNHYYYKHSMNLYWPLICLYIYYKLFYWYFLYSFDLSSYYPPVHRSTRSQ